MKKLILLLFIPFFSISQSWNYSEESNPFDGKTLFVIAKGYGGNFPYDKPSLVFRYRVNTDLLEIYISGQGYSGCDGNLIQISYDNNPDNVISYYVYEGKGGDSVFFTQSIFLELIRNLKKYSIISVRFENDCTVNTFSIGLNGSSSALDKLTEQTVSYSRQGIIENEKRLEAKRIALEAQRIALENEKKEQEKIFLQKENERKKLLAVRDSLILKTLKRLKDSMLINDISEKDIKTLESSLTRALKVEYDIYDNLDNINSVVAKPHTEIYLREIGKYRAYIQYKEGTTSRLSNDKIISDKIYFNRVSDENKFKNRIKSFREDIDYIKLKENDNYDIDLRIISESSRIFSEPIYDTIITSLPNSSFDKQMEFEVGGRVQLLFASSNDLSKTKNIFGGWSVKPDSPLLKSSNRQFKLLDTLIKSLTDNYNKLDLYKLKNNIVSEGININSIVKFSLFKKRGILSKSQFSNGFRLIELTINDRKSTTIPVFIDTRNGGLIFMNK